MDLYKLPAHRLHQMLKAQEVSAVELCEDVLSRIEEVEEQVNAYVTVTKDIALEKAAEVDERITRGEEVPPLAGIPLAIKDNMCIKGVKTTCSSKILENYYPVYTATAVQKVLNQQVALIGKTNLDEFAMGSSTENSAFHVTNNPWRIGTVPGGSSGGSAAAVAAGEAVMALGSDTGGSIRQPASLCGVVGFKPTYGLVSRYGLVAFASSLDQIGPITKDVTDCALLLNCICAHDSKDSTSIELDTKDYTQALVNDVAGLRMGILTEFMGEGVQAEVRTAVEDACSQLERLGAVVEETSLSHVNYALSAYYIIAPAEASSNLARFDGVRYGYRTEHAENIMEMYTKTRAEGFGDEVKRRIMLGTYALSAGYYAAYYGQAQKVRTLIVEDFENAFKNFDVLLAPTSPSVAFAIGEKAADPLGMYLSDVCTIPVNLAGIPGISVPCGLAGGLPIGLQIMGKAFDEQTILRVAYTFEQNFGFSEEPGL